MEMPKIKRTRVLRRTPVDVDVTRCVLCKLKRTSACSCSAVDFEQFKFFSRILVTSDTTGVKYTKVTSHASYCRHKKRNKLCCQSKNRGNADAALSRELNILILRCKSALSCSVIHLVYRENRGMI